MKTYEKLNISVEDCSFQDIITSSAGVTTGGIIIPWNKTSSSSLAEGNTDMGNGNDDTYETGI